jgi:secreted PhoX family phosphatase
MRYAPSPCEGRPEERDHSGRLQLFLETTELSKLDMPDNVAVSPWGHLMVCEDKEGGVNFLRGVTPEGRLYTLGRNPVPMVTNVGANSELAGVCFSPDGTTLFLNVYAPGMTLAITGPWARFRDVGVS